MPTRGPFVPIPDTLKIQIVGHDIGDNKPVVCVMHARASSSPNVTEVTNVTGVFEAWLATMSAETNGEVSWDEVIGTDLNSSTGPQVSIPTSHGGSGGDYPPGLSAVVELITAKRGRSYTGRVFWPVNGTRVSAADGTISSTGRTNLEANFATLATNLAALSPVSHIVVASRKFHTSETVTTTLARAEIGRIRRRAFG